MSAQDHPDQTFTRLLALLPLLLLAFFILFALVAFHGEELSASQRLYFNACVLVLLAALLFLVYSIGKLFEHFKDK